MWAPSIASDPRAVEGLASYFRASASPGAAAAINMRMNREIDGRHILPATRVPTLILRLHRTSAERVIDVEHARYMAQRIPGAKLVELPGEDHVAFLGDQGSILELDRTVSDGQTPCSRARAGARYCAVCGYRRFHSTGGDTWRPFLARVA